ncbi:MAG: hypothetical protein UIJ88_05930 [Anaerovoracaceae bacterium]|nr:hypothetical protein [Anaerovoracaceae bacterium]
MATARRAYTSEYTPDFAAARMPQPQPERVRRTRQRPEQAQRPSGKPERDVIMTPAVLRALIVASVVMGLLLICMVLVSAHAAELQYSINQVRNENSAIQSEIDMLSMEIDSGTGIETLETFATGELDMHYPSDNESIVLSDVEPYDGSLADLIKQKAYA